MEESKDSNQDFLAQNEALFDHVREICLREFEKGAPGLRLIIDELAAVQSRASVAGLEVLTACLNEISSLLQGWLVDPVFPEPTPDLRNSWSDLVCELSNYFMFLGQDDELDLRDRVRYRLVQLAKTSAAMVPQAPTLMEDGSWGLFDETVTVETSPEIEAPAVFTQPPPVPPPAPPPAVARPEPRADHHLASHFLICLLGSQQYALPIHQVREILGQRHEKPLPAEKPGIRGLVTVRGLVCPVVDVSQILHAKEDGATELDRKKRCMVVCEVDQRTFCFHVDDVKQVAAVDEFDDPITPLHPENSIQKAISHVAHFQQRSVLFVKMREVIPA